MEKETKKFIQRPFSYQQAVELGLNKYALNKLIDEGLIERLEKGIYVPSDRDITEPEVQYQLAMLRCGEPSCICLLSALDYYHLTDQIPKKVWIMVPQNKRVQSSGLKLIRARNPQWDIGILQEEGYRITSIERTLVDCLLHKSRLGFPIPIESLKEALRQKKVKLNTILDMAVRLGVEHRVYPTIEALTL